jgi:hypothetical protein
MTKFASGTEVPVEKSKMEIEATVRRYGADGFMSGWDNNRATVQFRCQNRHVRFIMGLPARDEKRFTHFTRGNDKLHARTPDAAIKEWEQACRQKWRALALLVKAKLEAVESNIGTFESEFLSHIVLPDGMTVYEKVKGPLAIAYDTGEIRPLLGAPMPGDQ